MLEINKVFETINESIEPFLTENGFKTVLPDGVKQGQTPLKIDGDIYSMNYKSKGSAVLVEWNKKTKKMSLNCAYFEQGSSEGEYGQISLCLLDENTSDERDLTSIVNDFDDSLRDRFGSAAKPQAQKMMMKSVSRSAVMNGSASYDAKTLATRLATIFPELKEDVKDNVTKYGDFLPDEFFSKCASKYVVDAIRKGDKQLNKKLFKCLNEMYEDGNNEVQSIVAVTILGGLNNDSELLKKAGEYMEGDVAKAVVSVNKILASRMGGRYRRKLQNPPDYKPKKRRR